mgnify:CR=1 FL=1
MVTAKTEVDKLIATLKDQKPWYFKQLPSDPPAPEPNKRSIAKTFLVIFLLADSIIFAGLIYYFVLRDDSQTTPKNTHVSAQTSPLEAASKGRPKSVSLPNKVDPDSYTETLTQQDSFDSLYLSKINSAAYIRRKNSANRSSYDDSSLERKIKTQRSSMSAQRLAPAGTSPTSIKFSNTEVSLDGILNNDEWSDATAVVIDEDANTSLYFKTDGNWLYIAADVPREISQGGYDQLRIYLHAGLNKSLVNERIHIGKSAGVTSIRQTNFRWTGNPPENNDERWKKYAISDWGLYKYAYGTSSMSSGHRQYEAAIHLSEAGLHRGAPFTLYAEVETDPLKNEQGKFVERQYLGELGDQQNPVWMVF